MHETDLSRGVELDGLTARGLADVADGDVEQFYRRILEPVFPSVELATLEHLLDSRSRAGADGVFVFDGHELVAGLTTQEYCQGRLVLLEYVAVSAQVRGRGIGGALVNSVLAEHLPDVPVLGEIEDPRYVAAARGADPVARVRFYDRLGAALVPVPYVQPSLRPGSPRGEDMLLMAWPPRHGLGRQLVVDFLDDYYTSCEGADVVADDMAYVRLRSACGSGPGRFRLATFAELTAARPDPI